MSGEGSYRVPPEVLHRRIDAVVIGASAGGVDALSVLLSSLPADFRPAVLVVLHVPAHREARLVTLFTARCRLSVQEAQDKEPVRPGTVYFAPRDYHLLVDEGPRLALSVDEPVHHSRPSIDVLFESAAHVYGEHLAAFILTGANEDGAQGLEAVGRAGGLTGVQDPSTAQMPFMPSAALARCPADFVLPLEQMACLLRVLGGASAI